MKANILIAKFSLALCTAVLLSAFHPATAQSTTSNNATPALLLGFSGAMVNNSIELTWMMESQTSCKWFVIERSGETGSFDSIGVVMGINTNNQMTYNFTDLHMQTGNNLYRIRQVELDGYNKYSKVLSFSKEESTAKVSLYPNPAIAVVNFNINSPASEQITVQVFNLSGIAILTCQQQLYAGNNQQSLAVSSLKSGNYFLKISNREGSHPYVLSFVKVM